MTSIWIHAGPTAIAAFLASLVEFVEALTVVLAVGTVRGWRGALVGTGLALVTLLVLVAILGPALTSIPLTAVQLGVGLLLLLFGMRWLRKAILRAAGAIPLHDEMATYAREKRTLYIIGGSSGLLDSVAIATSFKITMVEGIEVVFIIIAIGAGSHTLLVAASAGAAAALAVVVLLGALLRRPVAMIPENALKFGVGVILCAFGTFWVGEGMQLAWPGNDWALGGLAGGYLAAAIFAVALCQGRVALLARRYIR